jgi:hypothetical protein
MLVMGNEDFVAYAFWSRVLVEPLKCWSLSVPGAILGMGLEGPKPQAYRGSVGKSLQKLYTISGNVYPL